MKTFTSRAMVAAGFSVQLLLGFVLLSGCSSDRELPTQANLPPNVSVRVVGSEIVSQGSGTVTFEWSGSDDGRIQSYFYKLDRPGALATNWKSTTETSVTFPNLDNGGYRFHLKAQDDAMAFSDSVSISIVVRIDEPPAGALVVDSFASCTAGRNRLGGLSGAWDRFPDDPGSGTRDIIDDKVNFGNSGCFLRLEYDVKSSNPAISGFFSKLSPDTTATVDLSPFSRLVFYAKGDEQAGFSASFQVELKDLTGSRRALRFRITGLTFLWRKYSIDFTEFAALPEYASLDFSKVAELVVTFADTDIEEEVKTGVVYLDDIYFQ